MMAAGVALAAAAGGVLGAFAVPWAGDVLLRRVRARADAWWDDSLSAYRAFRKEHPGREPASSAPGEEGALGLWRDDALAAALAGSLAEGRLRSLAGAGFEVGGLTAMGTDDERRLRFSFSPRVRERALGAVALAAAFALIFRFVPHALGAVLLAVSAVALAAAVVCDVRSRSIPLEACAVLALAGAGFQLAVQGVEGAFAGLAFALAVGVGCAFANRLLRVSCPGGAVGRGDVRCMGALALATGSGAAVGFAACYALAGLVALAGCATRRLALGDGLPMAPFFCAWLACGAAASVVFG